MSFIGKIIQTRLKWSRNNLDKIETFIYVGKISISDHWFVQLIMASNRYCIDLAKRGTAGCKECKQKIEKGVVRIAKIIPNPFTDSGGDMKQWFHVRCIFVKLSRARASTKKIDSIDDLEGWDDLEDEYKPEVMKCLSEFSSNGSPKKTPQKKASKQSEEDDDEDNESDGSSKTSKKKTSQKKTKKKASKQSDEEDEDDDSDTNSAPTKDDTLKLFRKICTQIMGHSEYTKKKAILSTFFSKGSDGDGFKGDLYLWAKMLLPSVEKRVYNLQTTQIIKIFSKIFKVSQEEMVEDYEQGAGRGDVSETIKEFFEQSNSFPPAEKSTLYLQEVDKYLEELSKVGSEADHIRILSKIAKRCTGNDLKYFIRFIKHDLRINAGPKPILEAINPSAYEAFQASRNLKDIVKRSIKQIKMGDGSKKLDVKVSLMTPVIPMLAQVCKDLKTPFDKYEEGFYVEVKYDGERVQLHKRGNQFSYFSRSLKPVMPYKVADLKEYIPKAFPHGNDMMLDCEILLVSNDGIPLPFGSLGAHKKTAFKDASVCLFVFDCLQFNDENLMKRPLVERRQILEDHMKPIKNHVLISELTDITDMEELKDIVYSVFEQGLEGVVIKSKNGIYEPGKRHWLKLKKDYLKNQEGKGMADSADLAVLGAYYGSGRKGGIMSVFLMGCYDEATGKWCTVTKVPGGDDARLESLQSSLKMTRINKDASKVPSWLNVKKVLIPDFVSEDPDTVPIWEISGAEFSKSEAHTASGISIRFPRITRFRTDREPANATTLSELKDLYGASKVKSEIIGLKKGKGKHSNDNKDSGVAGSSSGSNSTSPAVTSKKKSSESDKPKSKKVKKELSYDSSSEESKSQESHSKKTKREPKDSPTPVKKKKRAASPEKGPGKKTTSKMLLNIFSGVKLHIPSSLEKADELKRYFIAYDGDFLTDDQSNDATHVIISNDKSLHSKSKTAEKVSVDWLWDCIKLQKMLPTKSYKT